LRTCFGATAPLSQQPSKGAIAVADRVVGAAVIYCQVEVDQHVAEASQSLSRSARSWPV